MNHTENEKSTVDPHQSRSVEYDRAKPEITQPNSQFDHELFLDGITLAGGYFESGVRDFNDYATAMIDCLGSSITPYLLSFWESIRRYPGLDTQDMTSVEDSKKLHEELLLEQRRRNDTSVIEKGLSLQMGASIKKERKKYENEDVIHNREMHHQILATWKRDSPQMTKRLRSLQVLDEMAFVCQERMWQANDDYRASGMSPTDARETAEKEHLMLEPESLR
ncbi:hypothetical protein [Psychrobacter sp. R86515]|uniref:hypothetical protein n=1 Tax=Psychrobacter sp. R86515 TaxID=3093855 RepID=UPI0036D23EDC